MIRGSNHFYNLDLSIGSSVDQIAEIIDEERPEWIFHYAAINGTQYFYDIPGKVLEVNSLTTYYLMKTVKIVKEKDHLFQTKIVYSSSSEVYGEPFHLPSCEQDITYVNVEHNRDSYAAAKLLGEFYVRLFSEEMGMEWLNLRFFNVYGPKMVGTKYGQVIPEFITRLKEGEYPLRIYGNGDHRRSFCYVDDNVRDTAALALKEGTRGVFNIGNPDEISIRELGSCIMEKMGKKPAFEFLPEREGDHKRRCPDTSRLQAVIGSYPYITLEQGLDRMIYE